MKQRILKSLSSATLQDLPMCQNILLNTIQMGLVWSCHNNYFVIPTLINEALNPTYLATIMNARCINDVVPLCVAVPFWALRANRSRINGRHSSTICALSTASLTRWAVCVGPRLARAGSNTIKIYPNLNLKTMAIEATEKGRRSALCNKAMFSQLEAWNIVWIARKRLSPVRRIRMNFCTNVIIMRMCWIRR